MYKGLDVSNDLHIPISEEGLVTKTLFSSCSVVFGYFLFHQFISEQIAV